MCRLSRITVVVLFDFYVQCRFLDKMYSMSSAIALAQFLHNPRHFVLPLNPINPCKVCVVGPPLSGKSSLAKKIAEKYNAVVSLAICI